MGYPTIKLTSFDGIGRENPIRLALHMAGIPFEDERLSREEWDSYRSQAPFGQSPIMFVNGTIYAQSSALLRYVGNIAGLLPANPILAMAVDEIVAGVDSFFTTFMFAVNSNLEESIGRHISSDTYLSLFSTLNQLSSQQTKGFAVGDQLTIADLALFGLVDSVKHGQGYCYRQQLIIVLK